MDIPSCARNYLWPHNLCLFLFGESRFVDKDLPRRVTREISRIKNQRAKSIMFLYWRDHTTIVELSKYYDISRQRIDQILHSAEQKLRNRVPYILGDEDEDFHGNPDEKLEKLNLKVRPYNCLRRAGIDTVGDLLNCTEERLMRMRNLGKKSLFEIVETLKEYGFKLKDADNEGGENNE